jgi:hypothetical protein
MRHCHRGRCDVDDVELLRERLDDDPRMLVFAGE